MESRSESIKELTAALAKAQVAFKPIKRTEKVDFTSAKGRRKYNYAPLDEVIDATKEALSVNGLAITQVTRLVDGNVILDTFLLHSSGEWQRSELFVGKQDTTPQELGSALTYMRRYGLSAILGIASEEDDDAERVTDREEKTAVPTEVHIHRETGAASPDTDGTKGHWCSEHKVAFQRHTKGKEVWYSHKLDDGSWCNEQMAGKPLVDEVIDDLKLLRKGGIWTEEQMSERLIGLDGVGEKVFDKVHSLTPENLAIFASEVRKVLPPLIRETIKLGAVKTE